MFKLYGEDGILMKIHDDLCDFLNPRIHSQDGREIASILLGTLDTLARHEPQIDWEEYDRTHPGWWKVNNDTEDK